MPSSIENAFHGFTQWVSRLRRSRGYENVGAHEVLMEPKPVYHHATYGSVSNAAFFKRSHKASGRYDDGISDEHSGGRSATYHALAGTYGDEGNDKNALIHKRSPSTQERLSAAFDKVKTGCVIS